MNGSPTSYAPTAWIGNVFTYDIPGWGTFTGELAASGESLSLLFVEPNNTVHYDWRDLPRIAARSTPEVSVFGASGTEAKSHIQTFLICTGQGALDYTKPVVVEVWLKR
jgi:hypothetical protein